MWRCVLTLIASTPLLSGQFHNLATTDDGSVLYFSTSLRMRGTNQKDWEKIFRIDVGGLSLYAERERVYPPPLSSWLTNQFRLTALKVSGDGRVTALTSLADCAILGSTCFVSKAKFETEISGVPGKPKLTYTGQAALSRSGRYAVTCCFGSLGAPVTLRDLETGATRELPFPIGTPPAVSSAGVMAIPRWPAAMQLITMDGVREIATAASPYEIAVDEGGVFAIYTDSLHRLLARIDLATGVETALYGREDVSLAGLSRSGDLVGFLASGQLFVSGADGGGERQVTRDPAGIAEAALSGDGRIAYAVTRSGRVLRIDVRSAEAAELVGRTPTFQIRGDQAPVPGSAVCVRGTALDGARFLLDGKPVPIVSAAPGEACFQIPWETAELAHQLTAVGPESQFEGAESSLFGTLPFAIVKLAKPVAIHADFRGIVSAGDPAVAGEILHLYMTGLGPVSPVVKTGEPGPSNPPAVAVTPLSCQLDDIPAEVVFAGLAPGYVGYYQVSVRLPIHLPRGDGKLSCAVQGQYATEAIWIPVNPS